MPSSGTMHHLRTEISKPDPWRFESNSYERDRHGEILRLVDKPIKKGLEIGCANGILSSQLALKCSRLVLLDLLDEAIEKSKKKLSSFDHLSYIVGDISLISLQKEEFDLIVVAEVLYYLEEEKLIADAVQKICTWLSKDGILIFNSAVDSVARRWGFLGAETAMKEFDKYLTEVDRVCCDSSLPDEKSLIVKYQKI